MSKINAVILGAVFGALFGTFGFTKVISILLLIIFFGLIIFCVGYEIRDRFFIMRSENID